MRRKQKVGTVEIVVDKEMQDNFTMDELNAFLGLAKNAAQMMYEDAKAASNKPKGRDANA